MNVTEQDQSNGGYITYNIPHPNEPNEPNEPQYPLLSSQASELKAYIREHVLKYVQAAPEETDEAYPEWHEKLLKIEKVVYTKYMKKWSHQQQQQQPSSPSSSRSNSPRNISFNELKSEYEHLKYKYNELLVQHKSINDIQSKFEELEKYNLILLEQQNQNAAINGLKQLIQQLSEENAAIKLENDSLKNLNITLDAQHEQYEDGKLLMQFEHIKYQQKYENLEKKYDELVLKNELRESKMNKLEHEYKDLEIKYNDLEIKYNGKLKVQKRADYVKWNAEQITNWIVNGDKVRYNKYSDVLLRNMMKEGIDGYCMNDLDKTDLYRLGITQFKDKKDIYHNIRILVESNKFGEGIKEENDTHSL